MNIVGNSLVGWRHGFLLFLVPILSLGLISVGWAEKPVRRPFTFFSIQVPNARGELGRAFLTGINDKSEIVGVAQVIGPNIVEAEGFVVGKRGVSRIRCSPFTGLSGVNNSGAMVGECDDLFLQTHQAVFRSKDGRISPVDVPGALITQVRGINERGQVVGYYTDQKGAQHGFVWDDGKFSTFDLNPESVLIYPNGINNKGQIVGYFAERACNCRERGFLLSHGDFSLVDFPGAAVTLPMAINDPGQIAGFYIDSNSKPHVFEIDHGNFIAIDPPFPGIDFIQATGINNRGEIVGTYSQTSAPGFGVGFVAVPGAR